MFKSASGDEVIVVRVTPLTLSQYTEMYGLTIPGDSAEGKSDIYAESPFICQ